MYLNFKKIVAFLKLITYFFRNLNLEHTGHVTRLSPGCIKAMDNLNQTWAQASYSLSY